MDRLSDRQLARLRNRALGFIFQSYHLINDLRVVDNVELPLLYRSGEGAAGRRRLALAALEKVGLNNRAKHFPNQLSGGPEAAGGDCAGDRGGAGESSLPMSRRVTWTVSWGMRSWIFCCVE